MARTPKTYIMYAKEDAVRNLCRNRKSQLSIDEITAAADIVDVEIDLVLSERFYWPVSSTGVVLNVTPPKAVIALANLKTAAMIEMQTYAQNEAGQMVANPYGRSLEKRGDAILKGIVDQTMKVTELEEAQDISVSPAKKIFKPVHGVRGSGL
jgi:hypothetical protein